MSEEEKKAIKVVNKRTERLIEELKIEEDLIDEPKIAYLITQIEANKTLVNLIEKQSKEIKELKEKNKKAIDFINDKNNYFEDGENWQNVLKIKEILEEERSKYMEIEQRWKDKIKAKIEEINEKLEYDWESEYEYCKEVLQSLLEKE